MAINQQKQAELLRDLHSALTGDMLPETKDMPSNFYNSATGTLYCTLDGRKVAETEVRNAAMYFKNAARVLQQSGLDEKKQKAEYCLLAAEALEQIMSTPKL